jgi:5-amino-6-(5-phospho-D-ribitylamino)uracil phosphatase
MIKAIVLDVDGVIIGDKVGINSPFPSPEVIAVLKKIWAGGVFISLCTAKPHYSIQTIIDDAGLSNLHITQSGAVIINPIHNSILETHVLDVTKAIPILHSLLEKHIYTELYSLNDYYVQKNQIAAITDIHTRILQKPPIVVDSIITQAKLQEIVKVMPIAKDVQEKESLAPFCKNIEGDFSISWNIHPIALPYQFCVITAPGISKKQGLAAIAENLHIPPADMLAVGDSTSDWLFMEPCGYAAAMGNASPELKQLVSKKGEDHSYIGPSVDHNGIIDIFKHFSLL